MRDAHRIALGVPYNIASYSLLLHLIGQFVGIKPGIFAHTLVDAHIYTSKPDGSMAEYDHVPGLVDQLEREPLALPTLTVDPALSSLDDLRPLLDTDTEMLLTHFEIKGYQPYEQIRFKVAV